ncbi:MAG: lasso RiPP family leader peptide-containing protein [Chloroflexi bacterium]|nr:lasso RiPP family leader peptide-containing protein [Chloroflexota bacterium]
MYQKPRLERFGAFRELTQIGWSGGNDGFTLNGNAVTNTTGNNCDNVGFDACPWPTRS